MTTNQAKKLTEWTKKVTQYILELDRQKMENLLVELEKDLEQSRKDVADTATQIDCFKLLGQEFPQALREFYENTCEFVVALADFKNKVEQIISKL